MSSAVPDAHAVFSPHLQDMVNSMLPFIKDRAGALPVWTLTVLVLGVTAIVRLEPEQEKHTTLEQGLGPVVVTENLRL